MLPELGQQRAILWAVSSRSKPRIGRNRPCRLKCSIEGLC